MLHTKSRHYWTITLGSRDFIHITLTCTNFLHIGTRTLRKHFPIGVYLLHTWIQLWIDFQYCSNTSFTNLDWWVSLHFPHLLVLHFHLPYVELDYGKTTALDCAKSKEMKRSLLKLRSVTKSEDYSSSFQTGLPWLHSNSSEFLTGRFLKTIPSSITLKQSTRGWWLDPLIPLDNTLHSTIPSNDHCHSE